MDTEDVDLDLLAEYVGSDPTDLERFARLGLISLHQALEPLHVALANEDLPSLQACGHRAKSTARHLGAFAFGACCETLERCARAGQVADALHWGQQVGAGLPRLQQALERALRQRFGATG